MKLFIPVICYNRMCHTAFMFSLIKLVLILREHNIDAELYPIVFDSLINRARNAAVAHFMSSNCSHLLFLDSDIEFNPSDIIKLVLLNKSIVGIGYPKKWLDESKLQNIFSKQELPKNPLNYCTHHSVHIKPGIPKDVNDCMEVDYLTTGIMLINKQVIERLIQKYPERQYINDIDGYMGANKDKVKLVGGDLTSEQLGFAFPNGSPLVDVVNQGLAAMQSSGKLAEINAKFFSPDFSVTYDDIAECDENIPAEYLPEDCDV